MPTYHSWEWGGKVPVNAEKPVSSAGTQVDFHIRDDVPSGGAAANSYYMNLARPARKVLIVTNKIVQITQINGQDVTPDPITVVGSTSTDGVLSLSGQVFHVRVVTSEASALLRLLAV